MIRFTILLIAASCAYGLPKDLGGQEGRIKGGSKAEPGQIPYQALIMLNGEHRCAGVILRKNWILTAQHCVNSHTAEGYSVKVGTTTLDHGGDIYPVKRIILHDDYSSTTALNDLALLETNTEIAFNDNVNSIPLDSWIIDPDSDIVASGWGFRPGNPGGLVPNDLYFVNLKTISTEDCAEIYAPHTIDPDRHLCTLSETEKGTCEGDDGGPIVHDGQLRGIITNPTCGQTDVHIDVAGYADWITGTMDWD